MLRRKMGEEMLKVCVGGGKGVMVTQENESVTGLRVRCPCEVRGHEGTVRSSAAGQPSPAR